MTGIQAVGALLAALATVTLPGLGIVLSLRLRPLAGAAALAPCSLAVITASAEACGLLGIPWTPLGPLPLSALCAIPALHRLARGRVRTEARRTRRAVSPRHSRPSGRTHPTSRSALADPFTHLAAETVERAAIIAGLLLGGALMGARMLMMMGSLHAVTQTYDGIFHLNAVRLILDSGSASAWTVGSLARAPGDASFYPSAWHQAVSVVAMLSGGDIVVATNAFLLVVCAVVWPLGIVLLVRTCSTTGPLGLFAAGALSSVSLAFPMATSAFGVLFPFTLSLALIPPGIAAAARLLGLAPVPEQPEPHEQLTIPQALVLAAPIGIAIASSHPQGAVTLMVISIPLAVWALSSHLWEMLRGRQRLHAAVAPALLLGLAGLLGPWLWETVRPARSSSPWLPKETVGEAWQRVLALAPAAGDPWVPFGAVFLVCAAATVLLTRAGWLVAVWVWLAPLAVASLSMQDLDYRYVVTGPWYTDLDRVTALPILLAVPILAVGIDALAVALPFERLRTASPPALIAGALVPLLILAAGGLAPPIRDSYREKYTRWWQVQELLTDDERVLLEEDVPRLVPEDGRIAVDPWDGGAFAFGLSDRSVTTPFPVTPLSPDAVVISNRLHEIQDDPAVCDAVAREGVNYALDFGDGELWGEFGRFPAIDAVGDVPAAATEVARRGDAALLRLEPCTRSDGSTWG